MKKYKDIIAGTVVFIVAAVYFALTFSIKKIVFIDPIVGSARFPQIVAVIMMICAVVIILQGILSIRKSNEAESGKKSLMELADEAEEGEQITDKAAVRKGNVKVILVLLSFALFCFFMDKIGFGPASFLYLWSQMIIMSHEKESRKRIIFYGLLSLVISAVIFVLFRYGFGLILPKAMWF
mgnify:CR=1 FL=1